jgi:hypothetical protein
MHHVGGIDRRRPPAVGAEGGETLHRDDPGQAGEIVGGCAKIAKVLMYTCAAADCVDL